MTKHEPHCHRGHHHHHHHIALDGDQAKRLGRLRLAFWLNFCFTLLEIFGGILTNSMAIISDAIHDFGDSVAILTALVLEKKSQQRGDLRFSYGYRRLSTLSALITGVVLVTGSLVVIGKCVPRLWNPTQPNTEGMLALAVLGVAVNGFAAWRVSHGNSLNERVITWHLIEDLMGWVIVLVGSVLIRVFDLPILDPLMAIMLSLWVMWNVRKTLQEATNIFLQATPTELNVREVETMIRQQPMVHSCHHTHIWSLDGEAHILTSHVVLSSVPDVLALAEIKRNIRQVLAQSFRISEATIEFEILGENCEHPEHEVQG